MVFLAPNEPPLQAANPNLIPKPTHPLAAWKAPLGDKNTKHAKQSKHMQFGSDSDI